MNLSSRFLKILRFFSIFSVFLTDSSFQMDLKRGGEPGLLIIIEAAEGREFDFFSKIFDFF